MKRIVIVGGGYAGIRVARDLGRYKKRHRKAAFEIVLVSESPVHSEVTSAYEVATAYLKTDSTKSSEVIRKHVEEPLADIFSSLPVAVKVAKVKRVDKKERLLMLGSNEALSYDLLVLAAGSAGATFGITGVAEHAFMLKTISDALTLRHHMVQQFKHACALEGASKEKALTFVVVGGGASGVETAAEIAGHARHQCHKHNVDPKHVRIILVEAGERILGTLPVELSGHATRRLAALGIEVQTQRRVAEVGEDHILFDGADNLQTNTAIWTAGLKPNPLLETLGLPMSGWGLLVSDYLNVAEYPEIFAAGDVAVITGREKSIPATVPAAYTQGAHVAQNSVRLLENKPLESYEYDSPGVLIAIGRKFGVAVLPNGRGFVGFVPWLVKRLAVLRYWLMYLPAGAAAVKWLRGTRLQASND